MKTIVIYNSQTGFTQRYANWIAESANADCVEYSKAKAMELADYDAIIFGGWAVGGSISKLKWFKKNIPMWKNKKLAVFCVGASPIENPEIELTLPKNFTDEELKVVRWFYCPGGLSYENMTTASKMMMKMFVKVLKTKKDKTEQDEEQIRMMSSSYDISDIKYIEPIIDYLNA
ncbi:MAG: flavodoxin [Oscillospiraceae bacterium]|nr:flavodoxin [Oscillospiraceae bacterium]